MPIRVVFACAVLLAALLALPVQGQTLVVLPGSAPGSTASVFTANPFAYAGSLNVGPGAFVAFLNPAGSRYFVVTPSSLVVTDAAGAQVQSPLPISATATAAALSPDGRRLLVVAGGPASGLAYLFDVTGNTALQITTLNVGNNPYDVAVSLDSLWAYVLSSTGLTPIDLQSNTAGTVVTLTGASAQGTAKPGVQVGPNGLVYVNALGAIYELHPRTLATLHTIAADGFPGKLSFATDASGAAVIDQAGSDTTATVLDLDNHSVVNTLVAASFPLDRVFYIRLEKIYVTRRLNTSLYDFSGTSPNSSWTPSVFPGVGQIIGIQTAAVSNEPTQLKYLFVAALSTIYRIDLAAPGATPASVALPVRGTAASFVSPALAGTPASTRRFNGTQTLAPGAYSLPMVIRVLDGSGQPLANQAVSWNAPEAITFDNKMSTTNAQGIAVATAIAPSTEGGYSVIAALPGTTVEQSTFTLNVVAGGGGDGDGGDGDGDGGGGTTAGVAIVSGDGQVTRGVPYSTPEPLVVRVTDSLGNPASGVPVTLTVGGTGGMLSANFVDAGQGNCTFLIDGLSCTTDSRGLASVFFVGFSLEELVAPYVLSTVTATTPASETSPGGEVTFRVTTVPATVSPAGGYRVMGPLPAILPLNPQLGRNDITGQAGETLSGAIRVEVRTLLASVPVPSVGMWVRAAYNYSLEPAPVAASCAGPGGTVYTDAAGIASCDLVLGRTPGTYTIYRVVGGYDVAPLILTIRPAPPVITTVSIVSGSPQSAPIGQPLPNPLVVIVQDQFGNPMAGVPVQWAPVIAGTATLANTTTQTGANGRASNTVTLGNTPGTVQIRATAGGRTVTFNLTAEVVLTSLTKVGNGDNQTAVTNSAFTNPLTVQVNGTLGPLPNIQVTFSVTPGGGSATLDGGPIVSSNSQGQASVNVDAGAQAGAVEIIASVPGLTPVTFNLTVLPPGPQLTLDSIKNGASFQTGFGFGSVVSIIAPGLTTGLNMPAGSCISAGSAASPLPTRLAGMEFQFGGLLAPIFAICLNADGSEQANVQAPFELAPVVPPPGVSVTVRSGAGTANPVETTINGVAVANALPGIFEYMVGSQKVAVAVRVSDGSYIGPGNAAHPGDQIRVYVTGMGPVQPWVPTNRPGVGGQGMYFTPLVTLGGTPMGGVRAEYAENMIGIFVVTFQIPSSQPTGAAVPLTVGVLTDQGATVTSPASQIAIQ